MTFQWNGNTVQNPLWNGTEVQRIQRNGVTIWERAYNFGTIFVGDTTNLNVRSYILSLTDWNGADPVIGDVVFSGPVWQTTPMANNGAGVYVPGHQFPAGSEINLVNIDCYGAGGRGGEVTSANTITAGVGGGSGLRVTNNNNLVLRLTGSGRVHGGGGGGGAILVQQTYMGSTLYGGCGGGGGRGRVPGQGGSVFSGAGQFFAAGTSASAILPGEGGAASMPSGPYRGGDGGVFGQDGTVASSEGPTITNSSPAGLGGRSIIGLNQIASVSSGITLFGPTTNT